MHYCVFFYLGGYLYCENASSENLPVDANKQDVLTRIKACIWTAISVGGSAVGGILNDFNGIMAKSASYGLDLLVSIAGILMVYYCVQGFKGTFKSVMKTKIWNLLGRDSFGVYLFHQQIIYLTIIPLNGHVHPVVQVILSFVIAICISEALVGFFRRWKLTNIVLGL